MKEKRTAKSVPGKKEQSGPSAAELIEKYRNAPQLIPLELRTEEVARLREQHAKLKEAVTALLRESPLLQDCPHEGSVTWELVKKVLEAME